MKLVGIGLLIAISGYMLRSFGWKGVPVLISVGLIAMIGEGLADVALPIAELFDSLSDEAEDVTKTALKIVALGYLFGISTDIATELSEHTVAKGLEIAGRLETVFLILPYLGKMINEVLSLING